MYASDVPIRPGSGWSTVQLGHTVSEVRAALATNGHPYDLAEDGFSIDIYAPETTFYFNGAEPKRLVQIVFYDKGHRIDGQPVIGLPLGEAMLPYRVSSEDDTLWSLVSIEEEFPQGNPLPNSKRIRKASPTEKIESGTLWIKSQGVGLVMLFGVVHALAIREAGATPDVGCGSLDAATMTLALEAKPADSDASRPQTSTARFPTASWPSTGKPQTTLRFRVVCALLAVLFAALPIGIVYRDLTAWKGSRTVLGRIVGAHPEGPFPDAVIVQYVDADAMDHQARIPTTYTTAREIGQEVELQYLPDQPDRAMTRLQIRDEGWSLSPYLLFGSFALATFLIHLAFPNQIRFGGKRSKS